MSVDAPEPLDPSEITDRFKLLVVVIIVTTTLVAGGVGYLESRADSRSDNASAEAEQHAIAALTLTTRSQNSGLAEYDAYIASQISKTSEAVAWRRFLQETDAGPEEAANIEREVWADVATESQRQSSIDVEGPQGPGNDPLFPSRFLAERKRSALVATALQDGANEESSAWGAMAVTFTAILTLLAVALYLLGSSLAMRREIGRILAVGGTLLAGVAALWTIQVARTEPQPQNEKAAEFFADGMVALESASGQAAYAHAEELLTKAINARPTFARAYVERSHAAFAAGSSHVTGVQSSTPDAGALERSTRDLRTAESLGLESSELFDSLGYSDLLPGVTGGRPEVIEEGVTYIQRALARDPDDVYSRLNLGMGLLAAKRFDEAKKAYERAMLSALYLDAEAASQEGRAPEELRNDPFLVREWVSGGLTDLQILIDNTEPAIAEAAADLKQFIVGSATRATGELGVADTDATIDGIELLVFPSQVQHSAVYEDPGDDDSLWVQWYHRPSPDLGWAPLSVVSGPVVEGTEDAALLDFLTQSYPAACLPVGQYRAEFYSDGNLLATEETEPPHEQFEAVLAKNVNVGFCRLPEWAPSELSINGLVESYVSPDQTSGLFIVRFPIALGEDTKEEITATLDSMNQVRRFFLPDTVAKLDAGTLIDDYFLGFENAERRDYFYRGGMMRAGAGAGPRDPGSIVIGLVFGPEELFLDEDGVGVGVDLFESMVQLQ